MSIKKLTSGMTRALVWNGVIRVTGSSNRSDMNLTRTLPPASSPGAVTLGEPKSRLKFAGVVL